MKPCKDCPFRKDTGTLGGSDVEVYLGQASGPFWLPCHSSKNYAGKQTDPKKVSQCAGAATFRSNIGVAKRMPEKILILPEEKEEVFESNQSMYAHYKGMSLEDTKIIPTEYWDYLVWKEMADSQIKRIVM